MKKLLLGASLASMALSFSMNAETKYYSGNPDEVFGLLTGVSGNGQYAVVADDENRVAYYWDINNPEEFKALRENAELYAVADNGVAVGATYGEGKYRAVVYYPAANEWINLPEHLDVMNMQYATCITPDATVIAGYEFDRDEGAERGGRFYPVVWTLNESTGDYDLLTFNDLELPDHQGFITQCMTPDGKFIGGRLYCGAMAEIPALIDVENHSIIYWNKLETRIEPFEYKGEILGYFEEYYIDGYHDTRSDNTFMGEFVGCDHDGNFYGRRTVALSVSEDGQDADLKNYACIYNCYTEEWTDIDKVTGFSIGFDNATKVFATNAKMVLISEDGEAEVESIFDGLGFSTSDDVAAITHGSADGKVLGGIYGIFNPAKGIPDYYPFMIILDEPLSGISEIAVDRNSDIMILVAAGQIEVAGAKNIAVYDMNGRLISTKASTSVKAGAYVVKADNVARKVLVK